jgi:hypothetical protein
LKDMKGTIQTLLSNGKYLKIFFSWTPQTITCTYVSPLYILVYSSPFLISCSLDWLHRPMLKGLFGF